MEETFVTHDCCGNVALGPAYNCPHINAPGHVGNPTEQVPVHRNLIEELGELVDKLEKMRENPPQGAALVIEPIGSEFGDLLTDEAKVATSKRHTKVVGPTTPEYKTIFLSTTVKSADKIPAAAKAIADEVNVLASLGKVLGVLAPLSKLRLAKKWLLNNEFIGWQDMDGGNHFGFGMETAVPEGASLQADDWAIFCFVTVPWEFEPEWFAEAVDLKLYAREGEVGSEFEGA